MSLEDLRREIDQIDFELLKLLKTRMETAQMTRKLKTEITDVNREKYVLQQRTAQAETLGLLSSDFTQRLFRLIIKESKALQAQKHGLIGFQGEHGAYSEVAAQAYQPGCVYIPCPEFVDVFENVIKGYMDFGIIPIENSPGGAITQVNELLIEYDVQIINELTVPIHHCLLTLPGMDHRDIRMVYSHPQTLAQCRDFLARNHLEPRPYYDTAGAARMLSAERPKMAAALASHLCAHLYNLEIIKEKVEDHEQNITRFLVFATQKQEEPGTKCSIIFSQARSVAAKSGALFNVLKIFAESAINLTRIESMPNREEPGNYYFFLDFEGDIREERIQKALDFVEENSTVYKFLGCYTEVQRS